MAITPQSHPPFQVKDRMDLSVKEKQIFDRLLQVLRHFNLQTQLRVAGGWVRDKVDDSQWFLFGLVYSLKFSNFWDVVYGIY